MAAGVAVSGITLHSTVEDIHTVPSSPPCQVSLLATPPCAVAWKKWSGPQLQVFPSSIPSVGFEAPVFPLHDGKLRQGRGLEGKKVAHTGLKVTRRRSTLYLLRFAVYDVDHSSGRIICTWLNQ